MVRRDSFGRASGLGVTAGLLAVLGGCATSAPAAVVAEGPPPAGPQTVAYAPPPSDGLLEEPPANARPGECFAKVRVPGEPIGAPPSAPHAHWTLSPPLPGSIGPVWCVTWEPGAVQPVQWSPDRYGWIRVICDHDATPARIAHVQERLHAWGAYQGGYDGHYDQATAAAVGRFQSEHGISHGGYLSLRTIDALEAPPPPPPPPPVYAPPVYAPPVAYGPPPPPVYAAPPVYAPSPMAYAPPPSPVYAPPRFVYAPPQVVYAPSPPQVVYAPPRVVYAPSPPQVIQAPPQVVYAPPRPVFAPPSPCPTACGGYGYGAPPLGGGQWSGGQRTWMTWPGKTGY